MPEEAVGGSARQIGGHPAGGYPTGHCRPGHPAHDPDRLRQRAAFLRDLAEARALLARAKPWRTRSARLRARLRQSTFRV